MSLSLKTEIIKVVIKYLPDVPKVNYSKAKDKDYLQSVYVEAACDKLGIDYINMNRWDKIELHDFCHYAILNQYKNIAKAQKQAVEA
ncbi:hypothetical protein F7R25_03940 [Burkholderia stagnalis]|uniref:Uncharacterized protein n=1 Tax=Burkholderia stagnalis TaxID=1503054 RepID=A0A6L3N2Z9_9BURK|nr:hypothetical protein [Burkholderia stagnalis]KAB0640656.1 hypothetical protein F7R25_03940 [Burkholderia stagnalis]VWB06093.1 hypothetical protein BST28156_00101 [Burkholderia stagnalis]